MEPLPTLLAQVQHFTNSSISLPEELLETLQERARAKPRVLETFEEWRAEDGEQETCRLTFLNGRPDLLIMQIEGSTAEESLTEAGTRESLHT